MAAPATGWQKIVGSRWFILGGLILLALLSLAYLRAWYQEYQIHQEIKQLQQEAAKLEDKKIKTLAELQYVQSPSYIEGKARTELNLAKEGEHMVVVTAPPAKALEQNKDTVVQSTGNLSNPLKWWRYFTAH